MGSLSRMNRCERFVEEFKDDALRRFGWPENPSVVSSSLGVDYEEECVRFYLMFRWNEREEEVCLDQVFYYPENFEDDTVRMVVDYFEIEQDQAIERLKKAQLIRQEYAP